GYFNAGDYNTGVANTGNVNTGAFISGNYSNGFWWRGDYQGLAGISQTITVPDTAVPVKLHVPIFLDIPVTGTLGTFTVHGFRFPEITGDIFLIGIPFNAATLDAFSFPNISIVLPNIGINLGSGPDPLIDIAGTGGLLPIKIPLIDIPAAPGFGNSTTTPSSGFFNAGTGTVSGVGNVGSNSSGFFNLTSGSSGISGVQNFGELISGGFNFGNTVS
ncbi:hypothetical protein HGO75_23430, partial [Mycobacterium tuberculosis]|nr:hypothetical protein [Mycobacterium tuberculosis]